MAAEAEKNKPGRGMSAKEYELMFACLLTNQALIMEALAFVCAGETAAALRRQAERTAIAVEKLNK